MKRWHQDYKIAQRNWKTHHQSHIRDNLNGSVGIDSWQRKPGESPFIVKCACDTQVGRFRKTDAFDCGKVQCGVCHSDKFPKRSKTLQELAADKSFKEALKDYDGRS